MGRPLAHSFAALTLLGAAFLACNAGVTAEPPAGGGGGAAGAGGASTGGTAGTAGAGMGGAGMGGRGGAGGASGAGGARDGGPAPDVNTPPVPPLPPPPGAIVLTAISGNGSVGLDWTRDSSAKSYRIYWANTPGVTPQTGQRLESTEPAFVHRGLTNGMKYYYVVTVVTDAGEVKVSPEAQGAPGGEWVLEELGAGDFTDVLTGARVPRVPIDKRVQILLLPEGYLADELRVFHDATHNLTSPANDVDRWIKEVFDLDPYLKFREAFVIWYLPRASATHIDGGMSAFASPAAALWTALDNAGSDAFLFPPTAASKNFVSSFLLFDPARGRAGVSGHTTSCPNPADRNLTLGCAFGIGHAHEFTHAFTDVRDEYMEDGNMRTAVGAATSNVNGTNKCDELPWAHLLFGRGINDKADNLVGAFGRPGLGYHSELKCQMNGTHDNGKYWCTAGDLTLRVSRFCNFCRELTAFRVFYRTGLIPGTATQAFTTWKAMYRQSFFTRFGFSVPAPVPQTLRCSNEADKPVFEACVP
jgi:hypothetical protein